MLIHAASSSVKHHLKKWLEFQGLPHLQQRQGRSNVSRGSVSLIFHWRPAWFFLKAGMLHCSWPPNEQRLQPLQCVYSAPVRRTGPVSSCPLWAMGQSVQSWTRSTPLACAKVFLDLNFVPMTHYQGRRLQSRSISRWVTNKLHFWPFFSPFLPTLSLLLAKAGFNLLLPAPACCS